MGTNKKSKGMIKSKARKLQVVYSEPRKIFVEKYLSPKGEYLMKYAKTKDSKENLWKLYGKNRYKINPNAKPVKVIKHK